VTVPTQGPAVRDSIPRLLNLMVVDARILEIRKEREEKPAALARERKTVEAARARTAEAEARLKEAQKVAGRRDLDLKSKEADIKKLDGQLNAATSNKVYSELLLSIRAHRADVEKIEEQLLGAMDETEALEQAVEKARVEQRKEEAVLRAAEKEVHAAVAVLDARLAEEDATRRGIVAAVDADILAVYERIRPARKGVAMAGVVDGYCRACQMEITIQDITRVMGGERLIQCKSCNRILYMDTVPVGNLPARGED